jgi:cytochrome P450 family 97 subfamily B polypeptide 3
MLAFGVAPGARVAQRGPVGRVLAAAPRTPSRVSRAAPPRATLDAGNSKPSRPPALDRATASPSDASQQPLSLPPPPPPLSAADAARLWVENVLVAYGGKKARDSAPCAQGDVSAFLGGENPFFLLLHSYFQATGPVYKLAFGPKVFIVVQDPAIARSILRDASMIYDKGVLAEILEDIMGKGLIPADYATWKVRRRAIAPGFHKAWLTFMTGMFATCTQVLCDKLLAADGGPAVVDMETEFCSLTLDIIGKAVFNYNFGSVTNESPIIKAVYRVLREAEHRSTTFLPYWKIPGVSLFVDRQRQFKNDMRLINETLNTLIASAKDTASSSELTELEQRDYQSAKDPSLLRFLVDLRGEETTNVQLRDDLMTMLIAGHETTAALLTWATFELAQQPELLHRARTEIENVLGDRSPTYDDVKQMDLLRRILAETLRLYPEPPLLIRRALTDTVLPKGEAADETEIMRGTDIFINVYSLHRSPSLWKDPDRFDPDRWLQPFSNPGVDDWRGYTPGDNLRTGNPLYPNEVNADFAFLPFGGGTRKCVGDQFAMLESVVALAMLLRRLDFKLACRPEEVGMATGATIHTKNGLPMVVTPRIRERVLQDTVALGNATARANDTPQSH